MAEETHPLQNGRFHEDCIGVVADFVGTIEVDENSVDGGMLVVPFVAVLSCF